MLKLKFRTKDFNEDGEVSKSRLLPLQLVEIIFNEEVPEVAGFINEVLTKKSLRDIIGDILRVTSVTETGAFLR